jgi:hypothetical protein
MKHFSDGVRGYLFHGRFGSCVLDEHHLLAAARYFVLCPQNFALSVVGGVLVAALASRAES